MLECRLRTGLTTVQKQHYSVSIMIICLALDNNNVFLFCWTWVLLSTWYGTVLDWLKSYLSERMQSVEIGDETWELIRLAWGVPQGSVLGPSLFSLNVAPIEDIIKSYGLNCAFYADNTQLYTSIDKSLLQSGISNLQICIDAIPECLADSELVCNKSKTVVLPISTRWPSFWDHHW